MKNYICPELEYIVLSEEDVIATSGISGKNESGSPNGVDFGNNDLWN